MGLDVTAYRKVFRLHEVELDERGCPVDDRHYVRTHVDAHLQHLAPGIEHGGIYGHLEDFVFRGGGYGMYLGWRATLAALSGYSSVEHAVRANAGPFTDLFQFTALEGTIGAAAAGRLHRAFVAFKEAASTFMKGEEDDWFFSRYKDWMEGCEVASDAGMLCIH